MHKSNEDCFYFLTSTCAKGALCTYRHSPLALTCNVICQSWIRGHCPDPACPFRHSQIQRPMIGNGILCFYENTATGCLKPECTFIHSRPRTHLKNNTSIIRPAFINPTKAIINTNAPSTSTTQITETNPNSSSSIKNEIAPITSNGMSDPTVAEIKTETITRRIAIPSNTESLNEKKDLSENQDNNSTSIKSITRSVITDSPKIDSEETTTIRSRLIINRNVLLSESTSVSTRSIIPTVSSSSSNRVVISSNTINSTIKEKQNNLDSNDEEIEPKKKFKTSPNDISLSSSTTNRILVLPSNETTSSNDIKPIRLNRHLLPETKLSNGNSSQAVSTLSNEEKKISSPGTGLLQDNERRTMRLERFQKKPVSPTRSITIGNSGTINDSTSRNIITSLSNQRKRTAPETTMKDTPPFKRLSNPSTQNVLTNSSSSIGNKNSIKQIDKSINKTTLSPTKSIPSSTEHSRFVPQLITPPITKSQSSTTKPSRIRQPPSVVIKQSLLPTTSISTKPIEKVSSNTVENHAPSISSKSTTEHSSSNISNEEDEHQLLKLNESNDVVDTFALIDEALLEADHLLELI